MRAGVETAELKDQPGGRAGAAGNSDILIGAEGATAVVTLNRPQALNALTDAMRLELAAALPRWVRSPEVYALVIASSSERAFCAGGDVREMAELGRTRMAEARRALAGEYALNWSLDRFTKPTIALIDGIVMGGGVGLSLYGTHRVAGERYRFAMPETGIGLFPDDGVSSVLARLPDEIGMYLALTGRTIGHADAHHLGLATHCIPAAQFGEIRAAIADADPVDPILDSRHADPGRGDLDELRPAIARCFSADSVQGVLERLGAETGASATWAAAVRVELLQRSPLSLAVTHRQMRLARGWDLRTALENDLRLACRFLEGTDFHEGVRAFLIDRDRTPRWQPAGLDEVTETMLERHFAPLGSDDLRLPPSPDLHGFNR
jgi:enoyl-CoA hydratase/carnithine racemase